ncbi:MAG: serine hydrolase [bacterium]|nr:serine hydrolase [bacterium]
MIKFKIATLSFAFVLLVLPVSASAKQLSNKVFLDEETMTRGYTLQLESASVGIQPNTFIGEAPFWLRKKAVYPELPSYLEPASDVFLYQIDFENVGYFDKPIWLSFDYSEDPEHKRNVYYYDGTLEEWIALPTYLDTVNNRVRAAWHFPYSIVGVFDDLRYSIGPIKKSEYQDLGDINAVAVIAIDEATGEELYGKNTTEKRSIASLTKLMTAYVLFSNNVDLDREVTYYSQFDQIGARLRMNNGEILSMNDLMYAMTVGSANNAAYALVYHAGYSKEEFVGMMNLKAQELGLENTTFADPSGLDPLNQSTVADYAKFVRLIMKSPQMLEHTAASSYSFVTRNTGEVHSFKNTNELMRTSDLYITGSKTGYLDEALYCLALKAKDGDREVITVLFGSPSPWTRFSETERLMKWAFNNYSW